MCIRDRYHGVGAFQTVDVNIAGVADVAIQLGTYPVDVGECFENTGNRVFVQKLLRNDVHGDRTSQFGDFLHGTCHHYLVELAGFFL